MINESDGDFLLLLAAWSRPIVAAILVILAIVVYVVVAQNESDCNARRCPPGEVAHVLGRECVCTSKPEPQP